MSSIFKKFSLSAILIIFLSCQDSKKENLVKPIEISFQKEGELFFLKNNDTITKIDIELAENDYEQQTGLMHRKKMPMHQGMLFVYKDERPRPFFYMKNTQIALDLIYINAQNEVVEINKNTKPYDETPISANQPAKYVLEVNSGFVDTYNITDSITIQFNTISK